MASAYHAPLAGSLFIAEILFGTLMLASLGPVVISAVIALLLTQFLNGGAAPLYHVVLQQNLSALHYGLMLATGLLARLCGPLFIWLMDSSHRGFVKLKLTPPWRLALGADCRRLIAHHPGGVGQRLQRGAKLFAGAARPAYCWPAFSCANCWRCWPAAAPARRAGSLPPRCLSAWRWACCLPASAGYGCRGMKKMACMMIGLTGMAAFLAATTHAPIMSTLMICEMTGQYALLPGLLITCVVASVLSRTLRRDSIYRHHVAEHV